MKKNTTPKKAVQKSDPHAEEIKRYLKELNKDTERHISELNKGTERYIGAVTEDFQGRVSAVAEQFSGINKKLDAHSERFVKIENKLDVHTQMIGQLMVDVQEIKTDIKQKVDRSEFARLEKRVIALETGRHMVVARR